MKKSEDMYRNAINRYLSALPSVDAWCLCVTKDILLSDEEIERRALDLMLDAQLRYVVAIPFVGPFVRSMDGVGLDLIFETVVFGYKSKSGLDFGMKSLRSTFGTNEFKIFNYE